MLLMGQSQTWIGQDAAFKTFLVNGIVFLLLLTPEAEDEKLVP